MSDNNPDRRWQGRGYKAFTADDIKARAEGLIQAVETQAEATGQTPFIESQTYVRGFKQAVQDFKIALGIESR